MEIHRSYCGSNTSGNLVRLEILGTDEEIDAFQLSLYNWGAAHKFDQMERPTPWSGRITLPVGKLIRYFECIEALKFDPDRLEVSEPLRNLCAFNAVQRFIRIQE